MSKSTQKLTSIITVHMLLILIFLIIAILPTKSANALDATINTCDSNNFPDIVLNMRVTESGTVVRNLPASAFQCFENTVAQNDRFQVVPPGESGGVRLADIVFLIDNSGSMDNEIVAVKNNVLNFTTSLTASNIDFRLGLGRFGNGSGANPFIFNNGNLTDNVDDFLSLINQMTASGGTEPGFTAIKLAVEQISFRPGAQIIFILITDEQSNGDASGVDLTTTNDLLLANNITLHTAVDCNSGISSTHYCNETSIRGTTNGLQFNVTGPYDEILETIAERASDVYVIGYQSSNQLIDGIQRNVSCVVTTPTDTANASCSYTPGAAPQIALTPETEQLNLTGIPGDTSPTISVSVTDSGAPFVDTVTLLYRTTGSNSFSTVTMNAIGNDIYSATLASASVPGIDYYIRATDGQVTSTLPSVDPDQFAFQIAVHPNNAPVITHTPITSRELNTLLEFTAEVVDNTNNVAAVVLFWRNVGELIFNEVSMPQTNGDNYASALSDSLGNNEIEYFIKATDDFGLSSSLGTIDDPLLIQLIQQNCSLDGDSDCDRNDLNILMQDLGLSVSDSACGAACDIDNDNKITIIDARRYVLLCTRPQCEVN